MCHIAPEVFFLPKCWRLTWVEILRQFGWEFEKEVWPIYWGWFWAEYHQLVIWLKSSYFWWKHATFGSFVPLVMFPSEYSKSKSLGLFFCTRLKKKIFLGQSDLKLDLQKLNVSFWEKRGGLCFPLDVIERGRHQQNKTQSPENEWGVREAWHSRNVLHSFCYYYTYRRLLYWSAKRDSTIMSFIHSYPLTYASAYPFPNGTQVICFTIHRNQRWSS